MYLNDVQRSGFYRSIGLDAREYDKYVIEKTNETAGRVFPIILDVDKPEFYDRLEVCVSNNENLREIDATNAPKAIKLVRKLPYYISNAVELLKLYLIKPIRVDNMTGMVR
jgi:magnesium-protoporphyrin IX monomethyl ester (oxidative) cyclase